MAAVQRPGDWQPPGPPSTLHFQSAGARAPPSTVWRPQPPSTVGPPPATVRPAPAPRTIAPKTRAANLRPAGATTMKWYAYHEKHPSAGNGVDALGLTDEERLEQQLTLEADCDGVETGGYVTAEALNEHPSALPGFDRRLWSADPFYAWRTQEDMCEEAALPTPRRAAMGPPVRRDDLAPSDGKEVLQQPSLAVETAGEEPASWLHWFRAPEPEKPKAKLPKPLKKPLAPLPGSASLARWEERGKAVAATNLGVPAQPAQQRELPEPSPAELRELLEPELIAAGLSWEEVDEELWSELRLVGELRRAAAQPRAFPGRLAALCAPLARRMAAAQVRAFLEPELAKRGVLWQDFISSAESPFDELSTADLEGCTRQPDILARRVAAALQPQPAAEAPPSLSLAGPRDAPSSAVHDVPLPPLPVPEADARTDACQGPPDALPDKASGHRSNSKEELPLEEAARAKKEKRKEKKEKKEKNKKDDSCSAM